MEKNSDTIDPVKQPVPQRPAPVGEELLPAPGWGSSRIIWDKGIPPDHRVYL